MSILKFPVVMLQALAIAGLGVLLVSGNSIDFMLTLGMYFAFRCIGNDVIYHRLICHRAWQAPTWVWIVGNIIATLGGQGSAIVWCANHLQHHAHSDKEKDPHSPWTKSIWQVMLVPMNPRLDLRYSSPYFKNTLLVWFHRNYWNIHATYVMLLLTFYPFGVITLYLAPIAVNWFFSGLINVLGHSNVEVDEKTQDHSANNWTLNLVTFGGGYHYNHHASPQNPKFGTHWYQFDIAYWIILLCRIK